MWLSPLRIPQGWAVVRVDSVAAGRPKQLAEVTTEIGQRVRAERNERKLQELLAEWRQKWPVKVREKALLKTRSYEELSGAGQPDAGPRPPQAG